MKTMNFRTISTVALGAASLLGTVAFAQGPKPAASKVQKVQTASVTVTDKGFEPARVSFKAGVPVRLTFTRKSKTTCATSVVLPDYKVKKDLPLGKPVVVSFTPKKAGTYAFACGMDMVKGTVVVQ